MLSRVEGQIWIDRNSPYRLKYFVNGQEFEVSVAQNYLGQEGIVKGSVVILDGDILELATFPFDLDKVIGVAGQTYVAGDREYLPILRMDRLELNQTEITKCFTDFELTELYNSIDLSDGYLIGAPVYWFIGRTKADYSYVDSSSYKGKLTFFTPSGFQWKQESISDASLNIGYDNLPMIGTVAEYTLKSGKLSYLVLNINYSGFDSSLEWNWPYLKGNDVGKIEPTDNKINITARHGLFPNQTLTDEGKTINIVPRCFCDIVALDNQDTEFRVTGAVDNYYGQEESTAASTDRRTEILLATEPVEGDIGGYPNNPLRYSVAGSINYKFNKEFSES